MATVLLHTGFVVLQDTPGDQVAVRSRGVDVRGDVLAAATVRENGGRHQHQKHREHQQAQCLANRIHSGSSSFHEIFILPGGWVESNVSWGEERRGPRKRAALPGVGGCAEGPPRLGLHQPNLASKFAAEPGGSLAPKFAAEPGRSLAPDLAAVADRSLAPNLGAEPGRSLSQVDLVRSEERRV